MSPHGSVFHRTMARTMTHVIPRSYTRDLENWCRQYEGILALTRTGLVVFMLLWIVSK